jgi:hypothetical protein
MLVTLMPFAEPGVQLRNAIQAIHPLERTERHRQEQLCVPLVPTFTYWYVSAAPELLALAAARLEQNGRQTR